jgi:hypothetical protein
VKREVWTLCTLLTAMFAWKVASVMPRPLPVVVGVWAAAFVGAGYAALLLLFRRLHAYERLPGHPGRATTTTGGDGGVR